MTLDLDAIEARANAAAKLDDWQHVSRRDAFKHIACTDVPALVARVRELEKRCDTLQGWNAGLGRIDPKLAYEGYAKLEARLKLAEAVCEESGRIKQSLLLAILHGDDGHQQWLRDEIQSRFARIEQKRESWCAAKEGT
jgi:hypothetical protein